MTDLQISLIILGVIAIIGVIGYNKWKEIQARNIVNKALPQRDDDPLMHGVQTQSGQALEKSSTDIKVEPTVDESSVNQKVPDAQDSPRMQSTAVADVQAQQTTSLQPETLSPQEALTNAIDETIEFAITMELDYPALGEHLMGYAQRLHDIQNYQIRLLGLPIEDKAVQQWSAIDDNTQYTHLCLSILLADRRGPITQDVLEKFLEHVQQIAHSTHASFNWPNGKQKENVLKRSNYLYQFICEKDAKLGVSLTTVGKPWKKEELYNILKSKACVIQEDGQIEVLNPHASPNAQLPFNETIISGKLLANKPLFTIELAKEQNQEWISRLTVFLDVMQFDASFDLFYLLVSYAHELCLSLNAKLVDDNNSELTEPLLEEINNEVNEFHRQMEQMGVASGSIRARRLFNP